MKIFINLAQYQIYIAASDMTLMTLEFMRLVMRVVLRRGFGERKSHPIMAGFLSGAGRYCAG